MNWENVYVFLSSTFNDMHAERDYLIKDVFPTLAEWCERHQLRLVDIDLRWGVTEHDANENRNTVKICMERIDECRPFFLCFLGQRRGWVPHPDDVSEETIREYPELLHCVGNESVTEMEILHALYSPFRRNGVPMPAVEHAFFFLREPDYVRDIPRELPALYQMYTNDGIADERERAEADARLQSWREKIWDDQQVDAFSYTAKWDENASTPELMLPTYPDSSDAEDIRKWENLWSHIDIPKQEYNEKISTGRLTGFRAGEETLGALISRKLMEAIRKQFPVHFMQQAEEAPELKQQQEFLFATAQGYVELPGSMDALNGYALDNNNKLFLLTAPAGMGKSMMLANWVLRQQERGRDVFARFVGGGMENVDQLLDSLVREIIQRKGLVFPAGKNVREQFANLLVSLDGAKQAVIVLDGINQFDSGLADMNWLPVSLPAHVKVIASVKSGDVEADSYIRAMQATGASVVPLRAFETQKQREALANQYLSQYLKGLDEKHLLTLVQMDGADNPLFLKIILSELRTFGSFRTLMEQIKSGYGSTPLSAFGHVLERLEEQSSYSAIDRKQLVQQVFAMLACARQGLSTEQMVQAFLLSAPDFTKEEALESIHLLLRQMRPYLIRSGTRIDFLYESLKLAAAERYQKMIVQVNVALAEMFCAYADPAGDGTFAAKELQPLAQLPYHLYESGQNEKLEKVMTNICYLDARCSFGDIYPLLTDLAYESLQQKPYAQEIEGFIRTYAQSLLSYDNIFFSLLRHKGVAKELTDAVIANGMIVKPWIETQPIDKKTNFLEQVGQTVGSLAVTASLEFSMARIGALSGDGTMAFYMEKLGVLRAVETENMRLMDRTISISPGRPLAMCTDQTGERIAVAYENAKAEIYQLTYENGILQYAQKTVELDYYLPEFEDPVMIFHDGALYVQTDEGVLCRVDGEGKEELPVENGEVSGLEPLGSGMLVALRQGTDTVVLSLSSGAKKEYKNCDVATDIGLPSGKAAVAFSDKSIVILDENMQELAAASLNAPAAELAVDTSGIVGFSNNLHNSFEWDFNNGKLEQTDVTGVFAPKGLRVRPLGLNCGLAGNVLLTDAGVFRYQESASGVGSSYTIDVVHTLADGDVLYSLRESQQMHWLALASGKWQYLYQTENNMLLHAQTDGRDNILLANPVGGGIVVDTKNSAVIDLPDIPAGLAAMAGDEGGGFFLAERTGNVLYMDASGSIYLAYNALQSGIYASSVQIDVFGKLLVWRGTLMDAAQGIHVEFPATLLRFFSTNVGRLTELGMCAFSKREGEARSIAYDIQKDTLYLPLYVDGEGTVLHHGTAESFIREEETVTELRVGVATSAAFTDTLYLMNHDTIYAVDPATGKTLATLKSGLPFTALCANPFHSRMPVLIERERELYFFCLQGGTSSVSHGICG